jgi:hypothetical protein
VKANGNCAQTYSISPASDLHGSLGLWTVMLDTGNHSQVKLVFYMAKELEHQTTPQVMRVQALPKNRRVLR